MSRHHLSIMPAILLANYLKSTARKPFYGAKGKLKALLSKEEYAKLPEQLQDFYTGDDDKGYTLSTDDKSYSSKLEEFRANNTNLKSQQEKLTAALEKFKDIDPDKAKEAQEALDFLQQNAEAQLIKAGKFDEVIAKRTERMQADFKKREDALNTKLTDADKRYGETAGKYKSLRLDTEFDRLFSGLAQVKKGANHDILRRAREAWDINDKDETTFRDKEALDANGKPWTQETWAKNLINDAPYFFEQGAGSGAAGSTKVTTGTGGKKLLINPTPLELGQHQAAIADGSMEVVRR